MDRSEIRMKSAVQYGIDMARKEIRQLDLERRQQESLAANIKNQKQNEQTQNTTTNKCNSLKMNF
ncbi:MAG: hypothetical protein LBC02_12395 [Planctomycetaceae bacterium]|jgi:hypothetical protein|nr:hypothetical protein [Planctomycetaceae bacterium]